MRTNPNIRKLSPHEVRRLRRMRADGVTFKELGKIFCVAPTTVDLIVRRVTYKDVK